jgi:ribosomal protein S18 acetylase RimI-like enzyme
MRDEGAGEVRIRTYRSSDAASVERITCDVFAPASIDAAIDRTWPGLMAAPWSVRKWAAMQSEVGQHPERCFVAEVDGQVVGYVTTTVNAEHGVGRIPDLAVDSRIQGMGIGRRLLEHALGFLRGQGLRIARIETLAHNEVGQHLYPALGFVEVARQIHYAMPLDGGAAGAADATTKAATQGGTRRTAPSTAGGEPTAGPSQVDA